ncbi:hypothetical protein OH76DRAFT_436566 [Lentinus brumalis]|uniref:Uncharacterized protein n=1 Tax=Lentinus brumalis TaxID=2498619 RepID=A0A371DE07_9APHY|nr:hypothetical protein OH76DRAFT_436566 [Polyporus brumalis]
MRTCNAHSTRVLEWHFRISTPEDTSIVTSSVLCEGCLQSRSASISPNIVCQDFRRGIGRVCAGGAAIQILRRTGTPPMNIPGDFIFPETSHTRASSSHSGSPTMTRRLPLLAFAISKWKPVPMQSSLQRQCTVFPWLTRQPCGASRRHRYTGRGQSALCLSLPPGAYVGPV